MYLEVAIMRKDNPCNQIEVRRATFTNQRTLKEKLMALLIETNQMITKTTQWILTKIRK